MEKQIGFEVFNEAPFRNASITDMSWFKVVPVVWVVLHIVVLDLKESEHLGVIHGFEFVSLWLAFAWILCLLALTTALSNKNIFDGN